MKTYQYQHTDGHITDKQFSSDHTALRFLEEIGPNWHLVTPMDDPAPVCPPPSPNDLLEYDDQASINFESEVTLAGKVIGYTQCINIGKTGQTQMLRWFGMNATRKASGDAHTHIFGALSDVLAWHEGRTPVYVQHAVVPLAACVGTCDSCVKNGTTV